MESVCDSVKYNNFVTFAYKDITLGDLYFREKLKKRLERFLLFPTFPTSLLYREKGKEIGRNTFLYFLYFPRALIYREKGKEMVRNLSYISTLSTSIINTRKPH